MIDGVKIWCRGTDWKEWQAHDDLGFHGWVNMSTGEIPPQTTVAKWKGLKFKLSPSQKEGKTMHPFLEGSLHRFFNDGDGNGDNFNMEQIRQTVAMLESDFGIDPHRATFQNLEFGLNIPLSITAKEFIENVVSMPFRRFTAMDIKQPFLGKVATFAEYGIKIYDKVLQETKKKNGKILRVEMVIKKARYLQRFEIQTLADIAQPDKMALLGTHLVETFEDVIYYDDSIDESKLTYKKALKLSKFCSPRFWEKLNKDQRKRQRPAFKNMMLFHGANKDKFNAENELKNTWSELNRITLKSDVCSTDSEIDLARKNVHLFTVRIKGEKGDNNKYKKVEIPQKKCGKESLSKCTNCQADISHQKTGSKYCSNNRKCRDVQWNKKRQSRRQIFRQVEERNLNQILNCQIQVISEMEISIFYNDGSFQKFGFRHSAKLSGMLRAVIRVEFVFDGSAVVLTTRRAKKMTKHILQISKRKTVGTK